MANIELVVKISEEDYDIIKNYTSPITWAEYLIKNGIPLPKGHGRLGDLDALEQEMINGIKAGNYEDGYDNYPHINNTDDCVECVRYADTIIEADREIKESITHH